MLKTANKQNGSFTIRQMLMWAVGLLALSSLVFSVSGHRRGDKEKVNREICRGNRLEIQVATLRYAVEEELFLTNIISEKQIFGAFGLRPTCPGGGEYVVGIQVGDPVTCTKHF